MPDREKVIKEYEDFVNGYECFCTSDDYEYEMHKAVLALLKEREAVQWINVKDKLPEKDGQYLVVYTFFNYRGMGVVRFSHNLHEIDEYVFDTENRPGWYEPDDEVGYFERTTVTHWAKLPEFPKEGR